MGRVPPIPVDRDWAAPQGRWGVYDPRLPGWVFTTESLLEARSWLAATQGPDTELTVAWIPD